MKETSITYPETHYKRLDEKGLRLDRLEYIDVSKLTMWGKTGQVKIQDWVHIGLLDVLKKNGDVKNTRYYELYTDFYLPKIVMKKIDGFFKLYTDIKENGFDESYCCKSPMHVLKESFLKTRFGLSNYTGIDCWNGKHRSAIAYDLGIKKLPYWVVVDAKPGTKKCESMELKLKVLCGEIKC